MMLFKLSLKNIKKSFKDYAIYFFTLILGVAIFYVFNAIDSQTVMLDTTASTLEIIKLMTNMLSGVSVFVSFILGFLIIYASRFLIKRRNKEFGIYLTLGMSKRKISMILFIETLLIGIVSLGVGLGIGVILSQFMSVLVVNLFEADMTKFTFIFSTDACIKTLIYFSIMYLLVMIFNTINISKCKLIDLLHSKKKSEKIRFKNPWLCTIVFIISCIVLGYAYYLVTGGLDKLDSAQDILIPIALGSISTFFLFWSISGLLLKIFEKFKKLYYKGLNAFTLRQFSSKINTTVFSMTIICLMLFVTICVLSSALSIKNSMTANIEELAPVDVMMDISDGSGSYEEDFSSKFENIYAENIDLDYFFGDYAVFNEYRILGFHLGDSFGDALDEIMKKYPFLALGTTQKIIKISDYNKVAKLYGNKEYSLKDNEYMIIADYESMVNVRNIALGKNAKIEINGFTLVPKYDKCMEGFVEIASNHINDGIILVPDSLDLGKEVYVHHLLVGKYKNQDKKERQRLEEELTLKNGLDFTAGLYLSLSTKIEITESSVGLGALVTFIGLYLGIIFLISSAALLALKELSESTDNVERFAMIRKLGADERMINKALFRQIAIFFMFPLLIAIIHSIVGIKFCSIILETFGKEKMLESVLMTAIFLILIYGGYFLITYLCSKNIIRERR